MINIKKIITLLTLAILTLGCAREAIVSSIVDSSSPTFTFQFESSFNSVDSNTSITKSGVDAVTSPTVRIATDRELYLKNVTLFVFKNDVPKVTTDEHGNTVSITPDPNGEMILYSAMKESGNSGEDNYARYYRASVPEYNGPVAAVGVANISPSILQKLKDDFDNNSRTIKYSDFLYETRLEIGTSISPLTGKTTVATDNLILENSDEGLLPIAVDPIMLKTLTHADVSAGLGTEPPKSKFGYSRLDVMLYANPSAADDPFHTPANRAAVSLKSAWLCNISNIPIYTGNESGKAFIDHGNAVTPATNQSTEETEAYNKYVYNGTTYNFDDDDYIQGLYMYPNTKAAGTTEAPWVFIVIEAITPECEFTTTTITDTDGSIKEVKEYTPEFFKILIKYETKDEDGNSVTSFALNRNAQYKIKLRRFEGNGYSSLLEALNNPPSNVQYDIEVDSSTGNEFVVTNGTSYMALSNTTVDIYGKSSEIVDMEFEGFTVHYKHNEKAAAGFSDDVWDSVERRASSETAGLVVANADDFKANLQEGVTYPIKLNLTSDFFTNAVKREDSNRPGKYIYTGEMAVRVGNLLQRISVNFYDFMSDEREIKTYETPYYTYAYFDYDDSSVEDIATWIRLGNTTDLEYSAKNNGGVPLVLTDLSSGYRDSFLSPVHVYNSNGESVRVYIMQEYVDEVDFSDKAIVNYYIGGTFADNTELVLSNTYMLRPAQGIARKYYIPISTRIKEVWGNDSYVTAAEKEANSSYYNNGVFELPEEWDVKVVWYDSQRVADGNFIIKKEKPNPITEEERFSITIPTNSQNLGVMMIAVVDDSPEEKIMWCWTFWITNYDPLGIARDNDLAYPEGATDLTKMGTYLEGGIFHAASEGIKSQDAIHRYAGDNWKTTGLNYGRFAMDRNFGAFDKSVIGHGTVYNASNTVCISDPLSGSLTVQFASPRPLPGAGALDINKKRIAEFPYNWSPLVPTSENGYTTVINALRNPFIFYIGIKTYSHWLFDSYGAGLPDNIWGDISLSRKTVAHKIEKSIFDPSPLGWMVPNYNTYDDFPGQLAKNTPGNDSTFKIYRGFATFPYVAYRGSSDGKFKNPKADYAEAFIRTNETYSNNTSDNYCLRLFHDAVDGLAGGGKGAGCTIRPVTQARYIKPATP